MIKYTSNNCCWCKITTCDAKLRQYITKRQCQKILSNLHASTCTSVYICKCQYTDAHIGAYVIGNTEWKKHANLK